MLRIFRDDGGVVCTFRDDCGALRAFWDDGIADVYYGEAINTTIGTWVPLFAGRNQDDIFNAHTKKAHSNEWAFLLIGSLAVFYSHMGKPHTTIDANVFHF